MENIVVRYLEHPKLNDPIFIEGLPGIGNVGKLAAEHLKDELKAVKFAEMFSKYFPPQVLVQEDGVVKLVNNEFHYVKRHGVRAVSLMGEANGYVVDRKSAQAVLAVLTKVLGVEVSFEQLEAKAKQIDQITSNLREAEAQPEAPSKEDLGYIG